MAATGMSIIDPCPSTQGAQHKLFRGGPQSEVTPLRLRERRRSFVVYCITHPGVVQTMLPMPVFKRLCFNKHVMPAECSCHSPLHFHPEYRLPLCYIWVIIHSSSHYSSGCDTLSISYEEAFLDCLPMTCPRQVASHLLHNVHC